MRRHHDTTLYSASDLVAFLACEHSTTLSLRHLDTPLPKAEDDASARLIAAKGLEHERAVLAAFEADGLGVVKLPEHGDVHELVAQTHAAMRSGADIVYQGTLVTSPLFGRTDFLRRVPRSSKLGQWSYEVVDTKLARSAKAKFAVQLAFYSELLRDAQGTMPESMHVRLGDGREEALRVADYDHYVAAARDRLLAFVELRPATVAERSEACGLCPWRDVCNEHWHAVDHLNQVAGISRTQIQRLAAAGIDTMERLGAHDPATKLPQVAAATLDRLVGQARLQAERRRTSAPRHELLPLDPDQRRGMFRLPKPSPGDLFFDMEGDPLESGGLEYLFGVRYDDGDGPTFKPFWAHDRAQERAAFEQFIDFVGERMRRHGDLHVYHYGHYERGALERLMTTHGTREAQLDDLLRRAKLVDLYKVVREGLRTSEPGLSIKDLEIFYMPPREGEIKDAGASIVHYEAFRQTGDHAELELIREYNEVDCVSTQLLRDWLLRLRPAGLPWFELERQSDDKEAQKAQRTREIERTLVEYEARLLHGIPAQEELRSPEDHARALLFHLLDFHRRAAKPEWWAMFARQDMTEDELVDDVECLGDLERTATPPVPIASSQLHEYRYPEQETKLRAGKQCRRCDTAEPLGTLHALDEARRLVTLKVSRARGVPPDRCSIGPSGPIDTDILRDAVRRLADAVVAGDDRRYRAARVFLRRDPPSLRGWAPGRPVLDGSGELTTEALRAVLALDGSYLFIQGPPGSGKTTIGSRLIVDLLRAGKRVGVTSNSHKVIHNLLHAVEKRAHDMACSFDGIKKSSSNDPETEFEGQLIGNTGKTDEIVASNAKLVAGTAWLFADPRFDAAFDYIFVDEAGQMSLANLMAVAAATRNLVLLGDHMQLGQPIQGTHTGHSGESALDYLLEGHPTVAPDRGIFLPTSYRMHEDVCRFISEAVYDGRLAPDPANQRRRLVLDAAAHPALRPTGIRFHPIVHEGCKQKSREEAQALASIVASLRCQRWIDKDGPQKPIELDDILVVAPYNAQVNLLREVLPDGMRIGTIDKFQGQEAPVVLVSMATSSGADLPRNIEFLYDRNRLNVAVSRAQCLAVVVASPALLHIHCSTPAQMALVNTLCWLEAYSERLPRYPV